MNVVCISFFLFLNVWVAVNQQVRKKNLLIHVLPSAAVFDWQFEGVHASWSFRLFWWTRVANVPEKPTWDAKRGVWNWCVSSHRCHVDRMWCCCDGIYVVETSKIMMSNATVVTVVDVNNKINYMCMLFCFLQCFWMDWSRRKSCWPLCVEMFVRR